MKFEIWPSVSDLNEGAVLCPDLLDWIDCPSQMLVSVSDLEGSGIDRLENWVNSDRDLKLIVVVNLYPTCLTKDEHLIRLGGLQESAGERLEVKLHTKNWDWRPAANVLLLYRRDLTPVILMGSSPNLGVISAEPPHLNVCVEGNSVLADEVRKWFDWLIGRSSPLTDAVSSIPNLVRPEGSREATTLWNNYLSRLTNANSDGPRNDVRLNQETGEVEVRDPLGDATSTASSRLDAPKLGSVGATISRVVGAGSTVNIDPGSRKKPLSCPLNPEVLGLDPITEGSVKVSSSATVSVFDRETLSKLEKYRARIATLLDIYAFTFGESQKWIPGPARRLFEIELNHSEAAGREFIKKQTGETPSAFVDSMWARIQADIQRVYARFQPEGQVSKDVVDRVIIDLKDRLEGAMGGLVPQVWFGSLQPEMSVTNSDHPIWTASLSLMVDIGLRLRDANRVERHIEKQKAIKMTEWFDAMNVFDDYVVKNWNSKAVVKERLLLGALKQDSAEAKSRCEAAFSLFKGDPRPALKILYGESESGAQLDLGL